MKYPICINCQNFAYWDDDFCCLGDDMRILQYGDCLNEDAFEGFPEECDKFRLCNCEKLIKLRKDIIADIVKENFDNITMEDVK